MNSGLYKIWAKSTGPHGTHKSLLGRFAIYNELLEHLENHNGLDAIFPEGPLNEDHEKAFDKCSRNPYLVVEKEELNLEESLG